MKNRDEKEGDLPGWGIFQEVSKVKVMPGLGIFEDPTETLTPDAEGKIPIYTRASDSFELTRFRATKARIQHFIQENKTDLTDSGIHPSTLPLLATISAGFFTEKALREFMGDDTEEIGETTWEIGKGWVTKKVETPTTWYRGSGSGSYGYGGFSPYYPSSTYKPKPKLHRTLQSQLKDISDTANLEMRKGALRSLENSRDITRIILLKVLENIDVMNITEPSKFENEDIIREIMSDIRWDMGYSYAHEALLNHVRNQLTEIINTVSAGVRSFLTESESPERLVVDLGVLVDVNTAPSRMALEGLFQRITVAIEADEDTPDKSDYDDSSFSETEIDFGDVPSRPPTYKDVESSWGRLRTIEHPLVPDTSLRKRTVTYKSTDIGAHLGSLDRILTDKRIFREMRPTPSGSLLVDCSGSMGLSVRDVLEVLDKVPGAVIGLYSGSGGGGALHIIARNGKVAADLEAVIGVAVRQGGNVVDGPSLEWLAMMPKPRIWYSDGGVTGLNDSPAYMLRPQVDTIMRRAGIGRMANQKRLTAAFRHMRREKTAGAHRRA